MLLICWCIARPAGCLMELTLTNLLLKKKTTPPKNFTLHTMPRLVHQIGPKDGEAWFRTPEIAPLIALESSGAKLYPTFYLAMYDMDVESWNRHFKISPALFDPAFLLPASCTFWLVESLNQSYFFFKLFL